MKNLATFFVAIILSATSSWADDGTLARIQRQYESIESFQAEFVQELSVAASREIDERHGKLFYRQPGLIRWETISPERELLIVGPEEVWNYFEEEEIAYRYAVEDVLGSAMVLRILSGQARLDEDFITEEDLSDDSEFRMIQLRPRNPEPNLVQATIWIDPDTFLLRRIRAVDFYGNTNQVELENLRLNPEFDPDLFDFTPPEGVMIH